jgi:hypothetical protein
LAGAKYLRIKQLAIAIAMSIRRKRIKVRPQVLIIQVVSRPATVPLETYRGVVKTEAIEKTRAIALAVGTQLYQKNSDARGSDS